MRRSILLFIILFSALFGVKAQQRQVMGKSIEHKGSTANCDPATNVHALVTGLKNVWITWDAPGILLKEGFEDGIPDGWTQIDANDDGKIWEITTEGAYSGSQAIRSASFEEVAITPDNYLITHLVEGVTSINYWVASHNTYWHAEHYAVMVSSTGTDVADFTTVFEETLESKREGTASRDEVLRIGNWHERTVEIPEGTKYIAFRHYNCSGQWYLYLDDITFHTATVTYNVTRDGAQIATGLTEWSYTDFDLENGTYEYCVEAVYTDCTAEPACAPAIEINVASEILPITNLTSDVVNDKVTLNWNKPSEGSVTVILEAYDVWGDESGYQLLLDADAIEYGLTIPTTGPLWPNCAIPADLYDVFEYKAPAEATPDCLSPFIVWNGKVTINIPAGTYDYCVVHLSPYDKLYIPSSEYGRKDNFVFESGKTYHFLVNSEGGGETVNLTICDKYTGEVLKVIGEDNPISPLRHSADKQNDEIRGLTGYDIYRDGTLIGQINNPNTLTYLDSGVEAGAYNYCVVAVYDEGDAEQVCINVTVSDPDCPSATNVKATVNGTNVDVTWNAPTKGRDIILFENFNDGIPANWKNIDADGDGRAWITQTDELEEPLEDGVVGSMSTAIVNGVYITLFPDNWLITPNIEGATKVSYYVKSNAVEIFDYEVYGVYASTTGDEIDDFVEIHKENIHYNIGSTFTLRTHDLPEGTKYVAFRHFDCSDQYIMLLDDIKLSTGSASAGDYTYTVTRDGEIITSGLTETYFTDTNLSNGAYNYCVEVVYETCTSVPSCAAEVLVGIENEVASSVKVYPNPARDVINVEGDITNIVMYNSIGQVVKCEINHGQIDVSSLDNGIYYLIIKDSDRSSKVEKVIIAK